MCKCDICGKDGIVKNIVKATIQVPFGSVERFSYIVNKCYKCGEIYSKGDSRDKALKPAIIRSEKEAIKNILQYCRKNGYRACDLERVLGLKMGYIEENLGKQEVDRSLVILLQIVRTHKSILDEADDSNGWNRAKIITDLESDDLNEKT